MIHRLPDWHSFWDIVTPQDGATVMIEMYGLGATEAVLGCVAAARTDNRDQDCQFWTAVLQYVRAAEVAAGPCN